LYSFCMLRFWGGLMVKAKQKGTAFEHVVELYYQLQGCLVIRGAGSMGGCDLVVLSEKGILLPLLVECKAHNRAMNPEKRRLVALARKYGCAAAWAEPDGTLKRCKITEL